MSAVPAEMLMRGPVSKSHRCFGCGPLRLRLPTRFVFRFETRRSPVFLIFLMVDAAVLVSRLKAFQEGQRDRLRQLRELGRQKSRQCHSSEDYFVFPVCHGVIVPASGRRLDLGCTTGNHALFLLCSFTNQVLA